MAETARHEEGPEAGGEEGRLLADALAELQALLAALEAMALPPGTADGPAAVRPPPFLTPAAAPLPAQSAAALPWARPFEPGAVLSDIDLQAIRNLTLGSPSFAWGDSARPQTPGVAAPAPAVALPQPAPPPLPPPSPPIPPTPPPAPPGAPVPPPATSLAAGKGLSGGGYYDLPGATPRDRQGRTLPRPLPPDAAGAYRYYSERLGEALDEDPRDEGDPEAARDALRGARRDADRVVHTGLALRRHGPLPVLPAVPAPARAPAAPTPFPPAITGEERRQFTAGWDARLAEVLGDEPGTPERRGTPALPPVPATRPVAGLPPVPDPASPAPAPAAAVPPPPFEDPGWPGTGAGRAGLPGVGGDAAGAGPAGVGQQLLALGQDIRRLLERIAGSEDPDPDERDEGGRRESTKVVWRERQEAPEAKEEPGKEGGSLLSRLFGGAAAGGGGFRPPRPVP